jgi:hypothetical protein
MEMENISQGQIQVLGGKVLEKIAKDKIFVVLISHLA